MKHKIFSRLKNMGEISPKMGKNVGSNGSSYIYSDYFISHEARIPGLKKKQN